MICEAYAEDQAPNDKGEMEARIAVAVSSAHGPD